MTTPTNTVDHTDTSSNIKANTTVHTHTHTPPRIFPDESRELLGLCTAWPHPDGLLPQAAEERERERQGHPPFLHVFSTPVTLPAQLVSGTYTLPDLKRFLAEGLCSLKVPTFAVEYREVVECGGYSWVAETIQLLTDLQCIMKYFCCLLQLSLLPVSV